MCSFPIGFTANKCPVKTKLFRDFAMGYGKMRLIFSLVPCLDTRLRFSNSHDLSSTDFKMWLLWSHETHSQDPESRTRPRRTAVLLLVNLQGVAPFESIYRRASRLSVRRRRPPSFLCFVAGILSEWTDFTVSSRFDCLL